MIKKIFIFLMFLLTLNTASADLTTNNEAYYTLDNTLNDETGNGNTLTNNGAVYTSSGKINGAYSLDGTNDYFDSGVDTFQIRSQDFSLSMWFKTSSTNFQYFFDNYDGTNADNRFMIRQEATTNYIRVFFDYGATTTDFQTTSSYNDGNWHYLTVTKDSSNVRLYIDGSQVNSGASQTGDLDRTTSPFRLGQQAGGGFYNGNFDEVSVWVGKALTSTEVTELYNSGDGLQYPYSTGTTPTINHNIQTYYNSTSISINLNTTTNTNMSYVLNTGIETSICNDCNVTTLNLSSVPEQLNNITFISTDENGQVNTTTSFTINPYQYFYFTDNIRLIDITNFTLNDEDFESFASLRYNNFNEGSNTLTFSKDGYLDTEINFNISLQTPLNQSFNITPSNIFFTLKDFSTGSSISNWELLIKKNDSVYDIINVSSTYQLLYNDTISGELDFVFQKSGYNPSYYNIDFQSGSTATEIVYLLNTSANTLMPITIKDTLATKYIQGVSVSLYGIKEHEEYFIDEQITDNSGKVYFTLSDDYLYKVIVSKDGYVTTNYKISPTETSYTFLIPETTTSLDYVFAGFSYSLDLFEQNNISYLRARYTDEDSLINKATLNLDSLTNYSIISSSDTLLIELPTNQTRYDAVLEVIRNGETFTFTESFIDNDFIKNSSVSLQATEELLEDSDKNLVSMLIVFSLIIIGFISFGMTGGLFGALISLISVWYLDLLSTFIALPLVLFVLLMFGFFRGGDY